MTIREPVLDDALLGKLIGLSGRWAAENNCWGYCQNHKESIMGNRVFIAEEGGEVLGYLFGQRHVAEEMYAVMPKGTEHFVIDELYVIPEQRSRGVGSALFRFMEETVRAEGVSQLMLSTASKDFRRILHFYVDELGMDFWSAQLFKKL